MPIVCGKWEHKTGVPVFKVKLTAFYADDNHTVWPVPHGQPKVDLFATLAITHPSVFNLKTAETMVEKSRELESPSNGRKPSSPLALTKAVDMPAFTVKLPCFQIGSCRVEIICINDRHVIEEVSSTRSRDDRLKAGRMLFTKQVPLKELWLVKAFQERGMKPPPQCSLPRNLLGTDVLNGKSIDLSGPHPVISW